MSIIFVSAYTERFMSAYAARSWRPDRPRDPVPRHYSD